VNPKKMPNTLAHLGLSGLATRGLCRDADLRWVYVGAIVPDLPWILQRALRFFFSALNPLDLRLYVIVQATLVFSLILSACFALLSSAPRKTFFILAFGVFFHLILDAFQIKWANGVHLLAPLDWDLFQLALFWPESWPTYFVTGLGLSYVAFTWRKTISEPLPFSLSSARRLYGALALFVVYLLLPFSLMDASEANDNHFVQTLRHLESRTGKPIAFDRAYYEHASPAGKLRISTGEKLDVVGLNVAYSARVSVRGRFLDPKTIQVDAYHVHLPHFRDNASYLGLGLIALIWGWSGFCLWWPPKRRSG